MTGQIVAMDLGTAQAKLVWYAGGRVKRTVAAPLPDQLVSNGVIVSMDAMADFLKQLAKENGIPRTGAAVILPDRLVFTRSTALPPMTQQQLAYNLPFEFRDYLTQEKGQYYFDYSVQGIERDESGKAVQMQLFACAVLKSTIEDYRAMLRRAGFRLKLALPEQCAYAALVRAHFAAAGAQNGEDVCVVDIGETGLRLHIFQDGNVATRRSVELGMRDLVHLISDKTGVDEHIAHAKMLADYDGILGSEDARDLYHRMAAEVTKAVNFYNYNNRERTLRCVYLCGGGAAVEPLRRSFFETVRLDIRPVGELLPETALDMPWLYAAAIGCAMQRD